eukprot:TRINITY_DN170_c1_g1_i1.p1 TRINITY_DN170_c1_g1~~TRINITY_DN170_c1_g1_i1.p1  ORF type:complete len:1279 (+),score=318.96 TRINITY_DN170_c1_g1_i1:131-3967(+)
MLRCHSFSMRNTIVLMLYLARCAVCAHWEVGAIDFLPVGPLHEVVWGNSSGVGSVAVGVRRRGLSGAPIEGGISAANWSVGTVANVTEYFEWTIDGLDDGATSATTSADFYFHMSAVAGSDGPTGLVVTTSLDGFTAPVASIALHPWLAEVSFRVPVNPHPARITVRMAASGAAGAATAANYVAMFNSATYGRARVMAAPAGCPVPHCRHGQASLLARGVSERHVVLGRGRNHQYGTFDCVAAKDGVSGFSDGTPSVTVHCVCNCYTAPQPYDVCDATSVGHPSAGRMCNGSVTVWSPADAAALDVCDTIDGDVTVASAGTVAFPSARRVQGVLRIISPTTEASFPMLEAVQGVEVVGNDVIALYMPRLRTVCGGLVAVTATSLPAFRLPSLGPGDVSSLNISDNHDLSVVDIGSVGGGPARLTGRPLADSDVLSLNGLSTRKITSLTGLKALTSVESAAGYVNRVRLVDLALSEWPASIASAAYGVGTKRVSVTMVGMDVPGPLVLRNLVDVEYLYVYANTLMTEFAVPNLGPVEMQYIDILENNDMSSVDLGSVGGGPSKLTGLSVQEDHVLRLGGTSGHHLTSISGLTALAMVESAAGYENRVVLTDMTLPGWPTGITDTAYGVGTRRVAFAVVGVYVSGPLEFRKLEDVEYIRFYDNHWTTALAMPNLGPVEVHSVFIEDNKALSSVDFGSIGGGPLKLTGPSDTGQSALRLFGTSSQSITTISGLTALAVIESAPGYANRVSLGYLRLSEWPLWLSNVAFGAGSKRVSFALSRSDVPGPLVLRNLVDVEYLYVYANTLMTEFAVPNLGPVEMQYILVQDNVLLLSVDLGSVGGGPSKLRGRTGINNVVLCLDGDVPGKIANVSGLTALTAIESGAGWLNRVMLVDLAMSEWPRGITQAAYGAGSKRVYLVVERTNVPGPLELPNVVDLDYLDVYANPFMNALAMPNLGPVEMRYIRIYSGGSLTSVDLGSIGGGPSKLTGRTASDAFVFYLKGDEVQPITNVSGLTALTSVESAAGYANGVVLADLALSEWPAGITNASYGVGTKRVGMIIARTDVPRPLELPNLVDAEMIKVYDTTRTGSFAVPNLGPAEMRYIYIRENLALSHVDLGSTGGGPGKLIGHSDTDEVLRLHGSLTQPITNVSGLTALTSVESAAGYANEVAFLRVHTGAAPGNVATAAYGVGAAAVELLVESTDWAELRWTAVTSLKKLTVKLNSALAVMRLPLVTASGAITGATTVTGNANLPDECASLLDSPVTVGTFSNTGNLGSATCPP